MTHFSEHIPLSFIDMTNIKMEMGWQHCGVMLQHMSLEASEMLTRGQGPSLVQLIHQPPLLSLLHLKEAAPFSHLPWLLKSISVGGLTLPISHCVFERPYFSLSWL
jgi:hypothetical protein